MRRVLVAALLAAGCGSNSDLITHDVCATFAGRPCVAYILEGCQSGLDHVDQLELIDATVQDRSGNAPFVPGAIAFTPPSPSPSPVLLPIEVAVVPPGSWPGGSFSFSVCAFRNGAAVGTGGQVTGALAGSEHMTARSCLEPLGQFQCPMPSRFRPLTTGTQSGILNFGGSGNDLFAVGFMGLILHSTDGTTWTPQSSSATQRLDGVWASSPGDVYLAGAGGVILHSTDHGGTWTPQTSPAGTTALHRIFGAGPADLYIVGDSGTILHSNGSGTWTARTSGTTQPLWDLWGDNGNDLWTVGGSGTILHSIDFGMTWSPVSSPLSSNLNGIFGFQGDEIFIVGDGGHVLYSRSGGSFEMRDPSMSRGLELDRVWGSSPTDVWVPSFGGILWHTTDRGLTWQEAPAQTSDDLYDVWGTSSTNIFVTGANGTILHGP